MRSASSGVPNSCDLDELPLVIDAVNNPVESNNDLADGWDVVLRNNPANLWKSLQLVSLSDEAIAKASARGWLSREMKDTILRRSSREAGNQISL